MQRAADDTIGAVTELHARYGAAFAFGFGPIRSHWLIGPEANALILSKRAEAFRNRGAYLFLEPVGGRDALISSDEPEHVRRRRTVQPAFHQRAVEGWVATVAERFEALYGELAGSGTVDLHAHLRRGILALVVDLLLGSGSDEGRERWSTDVAAMMDFANLPLLAQQIRLPLPGTRWRRFTAARARSDRYLLAEFARRRQIESDDSSVLGLLLATDDDGKRSLRDQLVSLVSAAFDTTSSALAWSLYLLLDRPERLEALREELAPLSLRSALQASALSDHLAEGLRLYPPASAGLRRVVEPVVFAGHELPIGALTAFSIFLTHRDPDVYSEPDRYRPERWRATAPPPFASLPFGYGARYCLGEPLARTVLAVALVTLLRGFRPEARWRDPIEPVGTTLQPSGGLPLTIERRTG
jgi:cytochrome P450